MKKKILFFTFFVLIILMITPYSSSISICKEQQNFGVKSKVRINENNLNDNNLIIKPFAIFFLFGQIYGWQKNEIPWEGGNRTDVVFICINVLCICFAHTDEYPLYFHKEENLNDRRVFTFINDTLEFKGIFGQHFVCGFIIARPII